MTELLIALGTGALTALTFLLGIREGKRLTLTTIHDEVIREKARLAVDRDEIHRMVLGQTRGWVDTNGAPIKLHTPSALAQMTDEELHKIARDRGLLTMQSLGDRFTLIAAIKSQQKAHAQGHVKIQTVDLPGGDQE